MILNNVHLCDFWLKFEGRHQFVGVEDQNFKSLKG